ncbi:MAG: cysteine desulfurase [Acidobacteriota bacterium]|nr:cysteine desulfurase [Acidobacteriota bacterium]
MSTPHTAKSPGGKVLEVNAIRAEFPILRTRVHGKPLVYLDNAATTQKPKVVLDAIQEFYSRDYANVHRGVYDLSERATRAYEDARKKTQQFLNAREPREIVFVRGTTEAVNLVAHSWGLENLGRDDEVLISHMEHHSNIVPWQLVCGLTGARLKVIPITDAGELDMEAFDSLLGPKTKIVSVVHVSNALGTVNPVREIIRKAHERDIPVLLDGAQAVSRRPVDVRELDCDFYAFSGHKIYGPSGIGALYARADLLEAMPPYQGGGEMIKSVTFEKTTFNDIPNKFEAGTPNITGAVGLGAALDFVRGLGLETIERHEAAVLGYATDAVSAISGVRLIGTAREKAGVLSFTLDDIHPHDLATILDHQGLAIRAGHHCAHPTMDRFGVPATARASLGVYNTTGDIDALVAGIHRAREVFA